MKRYDHDVVVRFVSMHSVALPTRELEAYTLFWHRGLSYREAAIELGISDHGFRKVVARLRRRVRIAGSVRSLAELERHR